LINTAVCPGEIVTLAATATGSAPLNFLWRHDGAIVAVNTNVLVLTSVSSAAAGNYSVEVGNSCGIATNRMTLVVFTNVSATPLTNIARCEGGSASFATAITGTGPYSIQWKKDGAVLSGKTNTSLALSNLIAADAGTYSVEIAAACNTITNMATLTVSAPTAATPLASLTACAGFPAAFATTPSGLPPFTYLWCRNGTILTNQTNNILTIASVTASNAGVYSVVVSGGCGSVTNSATLAVNTALSASMPTNIVLCGCDDSVIAPVVAGALPIGFKWFHDGVLIPGETNAALTIPKANLATPGEYTVEITGPCNSATNTARVSMGKPGNGFFTNPERITIADFGSADPYPSIINVTCAPTRVSELRVTLYGLAHDYPDDVDIMLVSPQGQALMLMSDAGGTSVNYLEGVTLLFDDNALLPLPDTRRITNGVYKPTNYGTPDDDVFDPPAPGGPTITNLAGFVGSDPNGPWRLFVVDDHGLDAGWISGGWSLDFGRNFLTDPQLRLDATGVTNGVFNAMLYGTPGATCFIEGSTNMRDWTVVSTNQILVSPMLINTTEPAYFNFQFFRASSCGNQ
jgi:hypothetical protein